MQQLLFARQFALALRRDLADENIARFDAGSDAHEALVVQVSQRLFRNVRNVARDFFAAQLRFANFDRELFDVDRREDVFPHRAFADQNGVFEVVTFPTHERDEDVVAQRQIAPARCRAFGQHLRLRDLVALLDNRRLIHARAFVQAEILAQRRVDDAGMLARTVLHGDACSVGVIDHSIIFSDEHHAGVLRDVRFHARPDQRGMRANQRHGLALHVGTHQRAIGVVVFQERNQSGGDTHELFGRNVHQGRFVRRNVHEFRAAARNHALDENLARLAVLRHFGVRDRVFVFFVGAQEDDFVRNHALLDHDERRHQEAVIVDAAVNRQRHDQTDVRAFGRFNRADAAVMGRMNVADFEARAFAVQAPRSECTQAPFVRQLRQRVRLIDDLRQFAAGEEVFDARRDRLAVDQRARRHFPGVFQTHAFADTAAQLDHALAEFVHDQIFDRADAAVFQMIDVVRIALAGAQIHDVLQDVVIIFRRQRQHFFRDRLAEFAVQAEAADAAEVVALVVEEQFIEQLDRLLFLRRVARAHALIDAQHRVFVALDVVFLDRIEDQFVLGVRREDHVDFLDLQTADCVDDFFGQLGQRRDDDFARIRIGDVARQHRALEAFGLGRQRNRFNRVERLQNVVRRAKLFAQRAQKRRADDLARAVDAQVQEVLRRHFDLNPRTAFRNDAAGMQAFAGRMDFFGEISTGRTLNLRHDHAFGAVDDELAAADHQRHRAEIHFFVDDRVFALQAALDLQRRAVGQAERPALVGRVARLAQIVFQEIQRDRFVIRQNRKHFLKDRLQTVALAFVRQHINLKELGVKFALCFTQVGNIDQMFGTTEVANGQHV